MVLAVPRNHPSPGQWGPWGSPESPTTASTTATIPANTAIVTSTSSDAPSPSSSSTSSTSGDCSTSSSEDSLLYSGPFTINNNLWGMSTGTGSQCLNSASGGNPVAWSTTWSWENTAADVSGENYIKSYANAYDPSIACQALSNYKSIPTSWTWRNILTAGPISYDVSQNAISADVSYDVFFGGSECVAPGPTYPIEVMVWLGAYGGLVPIGGSAASIGSVVSDDITFNLFSGTNTATGSTVYSFVVADGSLQNSYSGDLLPFFTYLEKFESGLSGMLLQSIQAGTEAATGSATFSTSSYTINSS
ncbi:hypothetical protein IMSHALPRED_009893 [Imshaugia aleurites]|uniref:Glycoside hydrolase family 12 protein n=1 Tax=Imshaugia aleurites TaxID=172621 RepID=A0A8H3IES0_9LECA|nr:hypothetical protein IMSHALPRED_009893 [Imshaugia aleurites]